LNTGFDPVLGASGVHAAALHVEPDLLGGQEAELLAVLGR
jgi:hypothetical protein